MADGYGVGLFDDSGPKAFAKEVTGIATELGKVADGFTSFGSKAASSLGTVATAIDSLLGKLNQVAGALSGVTSNVGGGGGGAQTAAAIPPPTQGGPNQPAQWAAGSGTPADSGTGSATPSLTQGTASKGGWWKQPWGGAPTGTASQENAQYTMGQRAVQSVVPAAIGSATNYAGGMVSTAIQGQTIGQLFGPTFGVSPQSLYSNIPSNILVQNPQDYAQGNYIGIQGGIAPGSANARAMWSTSNAMQALVPGTTPQQANQMFTQNMMAPQTLNNAMAFGFNFSPGGKMMSGPQQYAEVFQRFTALTGGKPTGQQIADFMRPGAAWYNNLQNLGWDQNAIQGFYQYALTRADLGRQGKAMPDITTTKGAQAAGLGTAAYAQLGRESATAHIEARAEPTVADAATLFNKGVADFVNAVNRFTGGGPGGVIGGVMSAGGGIPGAVMGLGSMWLGGKVIGKMGGGLLRGGMSLGSRLLGGGGGGALENPALLGRLGGQASRLGGVASRLGGLFGAGAAGEEGSLALGAGLEGAGAAADASVVGLPLGVVLGAAGLGVTAWGFRHQIGHGLSALGHGIGNVAGGLARGAGSLASGVGSGIGAAASGIGHGIGSFFGGLFGGGHPAATPGDPHGSLSALLAAKPPRNSLVEALTKPVDRNGTTLASALVYGGSGSGGTGAGGGMTAATASTNTMTPGSAWNYRKNSIGAVDASYLFPNPWGSTSSNSGSGSGGGGGGGTPAPFSGTIPSGGSYDQTSWAKALLTAIGAPLTDANVQSVVKWESREGGNWNNTATYNPLNTTYKMPGSSSMGGGSAVQAYTSWQQGLQATVNTLKSSSYNDIVSALQGGKGLTGSYSGLSTWSGGASGYSSLARGTQLVARTQLALLHRGEAVVPAADNYNTHGAVGGGGASVVHLNFKPGSVVLQVPANSTQQDMDSIASQFVAAISKPQVIAGVRSS